MIRRLLGRLVRGRPTPTIADRLARAHALFDAGQHADAAREYEALVETSSDPASAVNLGYSRLACGEPDAAGRAFGRALAFRPGFAPALVGLGDLEARRREFDRAVAHYRAAIAADPRLAPAHNNLALALTALGRLEEAWAEAEWRWAVSSASSLYPHRRPEPRWDGGALAEERLVVHWEQGFGDVIQYARFLRLVEHLAPRYLFECPPPLERLVARALGPERIVRATPRRIPPAAYDLHVPLASLPLLLGVSASALPNAPYLHADADLSAAKRAEWLMGARRLVGIVWRSSRFDPARDLALEPMLRLGAAPGVRLVSLQKETLDAERAALAAAAAVEAGSRFTDFADTADALGALDSLVSVDTSVAHVAGAMGIPTLLLLNEPAAERWMIGRDDTPWYPSLRLLRRAADVSWSAVVGRAGELLGRD